MSCKLDTKEYKGLESQVGSQRAIEIYNANGETIPNISNDLSIKEGDVVTVEESNDINKLIEFNNRRLNISSSIEFQVIGDNAIVKSIRDDFTELAMEGEFSPQEQDRTDSQYGTEEAVNRHLIDAMSQHEIDILNSQRREMGLHEVSRSDKLDSVKSPEVLESEFNEEFKDKIDFLKNKLGVNVKFVDEGNFKGKVTYSGKTPTVIINRQLAKNDTFLHEAIGHVYINSLGGLNEPRVKALADRLTNNDSTEEEKLEAVANVVGKRSTEIFDDKAKQSSFERFLDWLYNKLSKIFKRSADELEQLAKDGLENYNADKNNGFVPQYSQYQKMDNAEKLDRKQNTRNPNHKAYVSFNHEKHEYGVDGMINTSSPSEFATGTDNLRKMPDFDSVELGPGYFADSSKDLPIAVNNAIRLENDYRKLNAKDLNEDERKLINRFDLARNTQLREKILSSAKELDKQYNVSAEFGTFIHDLADKYYTNGTKVNDPNYDGFYKRLDEIKEVAEKNGYVIIPEIRYFDKSRKMAGSSDLVLYNPNTDEQLMIDFKTKLVDLNKDGTPKESRLTQFDKTKYLQQMTLYKNLDEKLYGTTVTDLIIQKFDFTLNLETVDIENGIYELTSPIEARKQIHLTKESNYIDRNNIAAHQVGNVSDFKLTKVDEVTKVYEKTLDELNTKIHNDYKASNKGWRDKWKDVITDMEKHAKTDSMLGIIEYLKNTLGYTTTDKWGRVKVIQGDAERFISNVNEAVANSNTRPLGVSGWANLKDQADSFSVLADIAALFNKPEYKAKLEEMNLDVDWVQKVNDTVTAVSSSKNQLKDNSIKSLSLLLATIGNAHKVNAKEMLRIEFVKNNPKVKGGYDVDGKVVTSQQWKQSQEQYILDNLKAKLSRAEAESVEFWDHVLREGFFDIGLMDKLMQDAGNTRSLLIQAVNKRFNDAEFKYREKVLPKSIEYDKRLKEFSNKYGMSIKELSKVMIDVDSEGNPTGYMVSEFKSEIYAKHHELFVARLNSDPGSKEEETYFEFMNKYTEDGKIKDIYKNPIYIKYQDMFEYIHKFQDEADDAVLGNKPLGRVNKALGSSKFYKLPMVRAEASEHRLNGDFKKWGKELLTQIKFKRVAGEEDVESMPDGDKGNNPKTEEEEKRFNVKVNMRGQLNRNIPLLFREHLEIDEMSADIATSLLKNYQMSINYYEKSQIQPEMELMLDLVKETRPMKRKGVKQRLTNMYSKNGAPVRDNSVSNEFKSLESKIEQRLYGMNYKAYDTILGMDIVKMSKAVNKLTANTFLIGNYISGTVNVAQGFYSNFVNTIGNKNFTTEGLVKAQKDYWKDAVNWTADIGSSVQQSETSNFLKIFDIQGEFEYLKNPYIRKNLLTKLVNGDHTMFMNSAGEHMIEGTLMYGVMNSVKIKNANGEYLDKDGKIVNKEKAASLKDVISIKDGKIEYSVNFTHSTLSDVERFSPQQLSNYMKALASDLHGQYDHKMKSDAQRTAFGSLATLMRRWLWRTTDTRWRGVSYATTDFEDLDIMQKGFDEGLGEFKEGYYTSTLRLVSGMIKSWKKDDQGLHVTANWNKLSDRQRAGVIKTGIEAATMAVLFMLASMMKQLADDEPDEVKGKKLMLTTYMVRRLYSEIAFFSNPYEFYKILKSPTASMGFFESVGKFLVQLTDPTEEFQSGPHRHSNKALVYGEKIIPLLKQYDNYDLTGIKEKAKLQFGY